MIQEVLPDRFQAVSIEMLPRLGGGVGCGAMLLRKCPEVPLEEVKVWPVGGVSGEIWVGCTVASTVTVETVVVDVTATVGLILVLEGPAEAVSVEFAVADVNDSVVEGIAEKTGEVVNLPVELFLEVDEAGAEMV
jgi:hypothetical protein